MNLKNKYSRNLKNIIKEERIFKYDILDWDNTKRTITKEVMANLERLTFELEMIRDNKGIDYTLEQAIEEINKAVEELKDAAREYDYSKLTKNL